MLPNRRTDPEAGAEILARLKRAKKHIKAGSASTHKSGKEERFQTTCRRNLIIDLTNRAKVLASPPKVFISYSDAARPFYKKAKAFLERKGSFRAMDWRKARRGGELSIKKALPQQIGACSCFLGIWVEPSRKRRKKRSKRGLAPSPWMPFELGIARGSGAICMVLIHENIDERFRREPNLGDFNDRFGKANFDRVLAAVEEAFLDQLKTRQPRWTWDTPLDQNYFTGSKAKYWPS